MLSPIMRSLFDLSVRCNLNIPIASVFLRLRFYTAVGITLAYKCWSSNWQSCHKSSLWKGRGCQCLKLYHVFNVAGVVLQCLLRATYHPRYRRWQNCPWRHKTRYQPCLSVIYHSLRRVCDRPLADKPSWIFIKRHVVVFLVAAIFRGAYLFGFHYDW